MSAANGNTTKHLVRRLVDQPKDELAADELMTEIRHRMWYFYAQTDGTMKFPSNKEGDLLKMVHVLLSQNHSIKT